MEAACAHLWHEHINVPKGSKATYTQTPSWANEDNKATVREDTVEHGPFGDQEVSADGHQAEGKNGDRVREEEEEAKDSAPKMAASPSEVQIRVDRYGLQHGAVQEIRYGQVDDQHVETCSQAPVNSESQDGHQVADCAGECHARPPQHRKVAVAHNGFTVAGEKASICVVRGVHQHSVFSGRCRLNSESVS